MPTGLTASRASENVLGRHDQAGGISPPPILLSVSQSVSIITTLLETESASLLPRQFDAVAGAIQSVSKTPRSDSRRRGTSNGMHRS